MMVCCASYVVVATVIFLVAVAMKRRKDNRESLPADGKCVIVTGCDSGFGEGIAKRLHKMGYTVIATCMNPDTAPINELRCETLHLIKVDVTIMDEVVALKELCEKVCEEGNLRFWGLVNNAGGGLAGVAEMATMEAYHSIFEVNYFGVVRLCKLFLPMLRKSRGRIVNMSSASALFPGLNLSAYGGSKAALLHFSRVLQVEVAPFGVRVITLCPWLYRTPAATGVAPNLVKMWENADKEVFEAYGGQAGKEFSLTSANKRVGESIQGFTAVVDSTANALTHTDPRPLYMPGPPVLNVIVWLLNAAPSRLALALMLRITPRKK